MAKEKKQKQQPESESYNERSSYRSFNCGSFTVEGFSRGPVMTFGRVPEYKLGFDLGWQPWEFMGVPRYFLTHTHLDHILALPAYLARRAMMDMERPTIYLPEEKVESVRRAVDAMAEVNGSPLECELVGVKPGDEIEVSRELIISVCKTYHSVPSVGYVVWERRNKLKPEYAELSGPEIRDLRASGVEITAETRIPRFAYLGDSSPQGLDENPAMYEADVLVAEMTRLDGPVEDVTQSYKSGHLSVGDYAVRRDKFMNKKVIAGHFSIRYSQEEIEEAVRQFLPDMLDGRLVLA